MFFPSRGLRPGGAVQSRGAFSGIYGPLLGRGWGVPGVGPQPCTLLETPVWPRAPFLTSETGRRWLVAQGHQKVTFLCSGCCAASRRQMGPGRAGLQDTDEQCGLGDPRVLHPDPACFHFLSRKCHSQGLVMACPQDTDVSHGGVPCRG